jgi:hypothetical protein
MSDLLWKAAAWALLGWVLWHLVRVYWWPQKRLYAVSRDGVFPQHHVVVGPGRAETMP